MMDISIVEIKTYKKIEKKEIKVPKRG